MNVLLVISNLEYGGAQRQVIELANNLDAARVDAHVCSLSAYVPLADDLQHRDRRLHVISKRFKFDATVVPRLARLLQTLGTDVVQSYLFDADIAARLAGRLAGTPLIAGSERNTDYYLKPRQLAGYRLTRRCVDLFIANSHAGADFNSRTLGHPPSLYHVVHNGVNTARFVPRDSAGIRAELGVSRDERLIGLFASFKEQKNHPLFLAAAQRVLAEFPNTRLLLAGDELYGGMHGSRTYRDRVHQLFDELQLRDRCLLVGNRLDVERLYPACDVTVVSSLYEGTPNVLLESMSCGVPVVATDVSDNARIVPDGRAGYVVPLGDERAMAARICALLADETLRRAMGTAARAWVEREFSTTRLAEKTEQVYQDALAARGRRPATARTR